MKAIEIFKASIVTHEEWMDYFVKYPDAENKEQYKCLGNASFHRDCIKRYNEGILDIEQLQAKVKKLEAEKKEGENES